MQMMMMMMIDANFVKYLKNGPSQGKTFKLERIFNISVKKLL